MRFALGPVRDAAAQQLERLGAREGILEVAEVDELDELLGREVGEQLPERLARQSRTWPSARS